MALLSGTKLTNAGANTGPLQSPPYRTDTTLATKRSGRRTGSRNKGYWFRKARGWYTTEGDQKLPLRDATGQHLKDPHPAEKVLKEAYALRVLEGKPWTEPDHLLHARDREGKTPLVTILSTVIYRNGRLDTKSAW